MGEKGYIVSLLTDSRWETEAGGASDFYQSSDFSGEAQSEEWAPVFGFCRTLSSKFMKGVWKKFFKKLFSHTHAHRTRITDCASRRACAATDAGNPGGGMHHISS